MVAASFRPAVVAASVGLVIILFFDPELIKRNLLIIMMIKKIKRSSVDFICTSKKSLSFVIFSKRYVF